jgi:hypothetical protein
MHASSLSDACLLQTCTLVGLLLFVPLSLELVCEIMLVICCCIANDCKDLRLKLSPGDRIIECRVQV